MFLTKYYRKMTNIMTLTATVMLLQGCLTLDFWNDDDEEPVVKKVSLHALAGEGRTESMNMVVKSKNGREVTLEKLCLIDSERFPMIEAIPQKDGSSFLKVYLDRHAQIRWQSISAMNNGRAVAILIDGKPVTWWRVSATPRSVEYITIKRPFPKALATSIAEASENNYKQLNPRDMIENHREKKKKQAEGNK